MFTFIFARSIFPKDRYGLPQLSSRESHLRYLLIALMILWPFLSILYNYLLQVASLVELMRTVFWVAFVLNLFFFYPRFLRRIPNVVDFVNTLLNSFLFFLLLLIGVALLLYFTGLSPYYRLGYPLSPGVFGYYVVIGIVIVLFYQRNLFLALFFFVSILLSSSRSAAGIAAIFLLYFLFRGRLNRYIKIGITLACVLITAYLATRYMELVRPLFESRDDIFSNRLTIWSLMLADLWTPGTLLFGTSIPPYVLIGERLLGAHNSLLDLALTYGIPFAVGGLLCWFLFFMPRSILRVLFSGELRGYELPTRFAQMNTLLFLLVSMKSLVTDTFWTNMGDPATLFVVLLLSIPEIQIAQSIPTPKTYAKLGRSAPPGSGPVSTDLPLPVRR